MAHTDTRSANEAVFRSLEVGDLLEYDRDFYQHWAVYIGDEEVMHLAGGNSDGLGGFFGARDLGGKILDKACIKRDKFWKVVGQDRVHKSNKHDDTHRPFSPATIRQRALSREGEIGYNIVFRNCEHFANWCRYGMERSGQVEKVVTEVVDVFNEACAAAVAEMAKDIERHKKKK